MARIPSSVKRQAPPKAAIPLIRSFRYSCADKPNGASMNRRNKARFNLGWNSSNALSKVLRRVDLCTPLRFHFAGIFPRKRKWDGWGNRWKFEKFSCPRSFFLYRGFVVIVGGKNVIFFLFLSLCLSLYTLFLFWDWALLMNERSSNMYNVIWIHAIKRRRDRVRFNFLIFEILFFHY